MTPADKMLFNLLPNLWTNHFSQFITFHLEHLYIFDFHSQHCLSCGSVVDWMFAVAIFMPRTVPYMLSVFLIGYSFCLFPWFFLCIFIFFFSSLHFVLTSLVMTHAQHNKHNTKSHVAEDKTLNNIPLLIWTEMLLLSSCCWLMSSPCLKMLYDIFMRFMAHLRSWWRR